MDLAAEFRSGIEVWREFIDAGTKIPEELVLDTTVPEELLFTSLVTSITSFVHDLRGSRGKTKHSRKIRIKQIVQLNYSTPIRPIMVVTCKQRALFSIIFKNLEIS